jgi:anti-anti-sigma factor
MSPNPKLPLSQVEHSLWVDRSTGTPLIERKISERVISDREEFESPSTRLRIWTQNTADRAMMHCAGDVIYQHEADHFVDVVTAFDQREIVIDLKNVRAVDAYGLGKLLDLYQLLCERGQHLTFANPSERLQMLFNITKLDFCFMCVCGRLLT